MSLITFGKLTIGVSTDTQGDGLKEGSQFVCPVTGTLIEIDWYLDGQGSGIGDQTVQAAVYADASNPADLLGKSTNTQTIVDGSVPNWYAFTGLTASVVAGRVYWLSILGGAPNDGSRLYQDALAAGARFNANTGGFAAGFTNPFGTSSNLNFQYSVKAVVETGTQVQRSPSVSPQLRP